MSDGWMVSSFSPNGNSCVSVKHDPEAGRIRVRNSNDLAQGEIHFTEDEWRAFVKGAAAGQFRFGLLA